MCWTLPLVFPRTIPRLFSSVVSQCWDPRPVCHGYSRLPPHGLLPYHTPGMVRKLSQELSGSDKLMTNYFLPAVLQPESYPESPAPLLPPSPRAMPYSDSSSTPPSSSASDDSSPPSPISSSLFKSRQQALLPEEDPSSQPAPTHTLTCSTPNCLEQQETNQPVPDMPAGSTSCRIVLPTASHPSFRQGKLSLYFHFVNEGPAAQTDTLQRDKTGDDDGDDNDNSRRATSDGSDLSALREDEGKPSTPLLASLPQPTPATKPATRSLAMSHM